MPVPSEISAALEEKLWTIYYRTEFPKPEDVQPGHALAVVRSLYAMFLPEHQPACIDLTDCAVNDSADRGFVTLPYGKLDAAVEGLGGAICDRPDETLDCLAFAAQAALLGHGGYKCVDQRRLQARVVDMRPVIRLRHLKANLIGRFVPLEGTVVRVSNVRPQITRMSFTCPKCDAAYSKQFVDGKYAPPTQCTNGSCRSRSFTPDLHDCESVDWQRIRLQEQLTEDATEAGRIPRTVEVECTNDLINSCAPGDVIKVCGTVKHILTEQATGGGKSHSKSLFFLYIEANSVRNARQKAGQSKSNITSFGQNELQMIRAVCQSDGCFRTLVNSLCPTIYGQELVKAGLLLSMFGGVRKHEDDKDKLPIRGDPHILIVGDPGLGKSQMLRAACNVAPRGVYVCGNTATASGLTVTMVKDSQTGDWALEAGALVLGDQGCCAIDEFDKMNGEQQALLEAMEQQSISLAKAGMICQLSARTSILAAANPIGGHYDRAKTVCENIMLSNALLSRFDLIFVLLDVPDDDRDKVLSEHVISMHGAAQGPSVIRRLDGSPTTLQDRLRYGADEKYDPLPVEMLRTYMAYSKQYCKPTLDAEARAVLQNFYLSLRENYCSDDCTPITTRQLESLIRLTQARAKIEMREIAVKADAQDVVDLMKASMVDVCMDDGGNMDFSRNVSAGGGGSGTKDMKRLASKLETIAQRKADNQFTTVELGDAAISIGLSMDGFDDFVECMNNESFLLKKGNQKWQLNSSSTHLSATQRATQSKRRSGGSGRF